MKETPVTVLLPVYNNEKINLCIDSVLNQTFRDFELLIIDNASTDHTADVVRSYDDERIRLIVNEKNLGATGSLRKGIDLIKTRYIARIDADDLMLPERLEKQLAYMENNPDYGIVGSWTRHIDQNDQLYAVNKLCTTDKGIRTYLNIQSPFYHPAVMLRNSILKEHDLNYDPDIKVAVEYDLWNRVLRYSKGCNLPEVLTYYRTGGDSLTSRNTTKRLQEYLNVRERVCEEHHEDLVLKSLKIERKEKKNLIDCTRIFDYLLKYLKKNTDKEDPDFASLKSCIYSRIYQACALENNALLGSLLEKTMRLYKHQ